MILMLRIYESQIIRHGSIQIMHNIVPLFHVIDALTRIWPVTGHIRYEDCLIMTWPWAWHMGRLQMSTRRSISWTSNDDVLTRKNLTLNERGLSFSGLTRSISWLLMPWLLESPSHHQSWYWRCKIGRSLFPMRKDYNYMCSVSVGES